MSDYKPIIRTRPERSSLGPKDRLRLDAGLLTSGERKTPSSKPVLSVDDPSPWPRRIGYGVALGASLLALAWSRNAFGAEVSNLPDNQTSTRLVENATGLAPAP